MRLNYLKVRMLHKDEGVRKRRKRGGATYKTELDMLALEGKISFEEYISNHPYKDLVKKFIELRNNTDLTIDEVCEALNISRSRYMFYKKILDKFGVLKEKKRGRHTMLTSSLPMARG